MAVKPVVKADSACCHGKPVAIHFGGYCVWMTEEEAWEFLREFRTALLSLRRC